MEDEITMRVVALYSFNRGQEIIESQYTAELDEVVQVINGVDASESFDKESKEKTMPGRMLYSPTSLNKAFVRGFKPLGWKKHKEYCDYSPGYYLNGYTPAPRENRSQRPYREMDFLKNKVGVEIQFGKYSFMVYNVCAKMTIFSNLGFIDVGIEVVPVKELALKMSTGVSYFEQFTWDLDQRGVADIDIPVLIMGITV